MIWIIIGLYLFGALGSAQWNLENDGPAKHFNRREWVIFGLCVALWPVLYGSFAIQDIATLIRER